MREAKAVVATGAIESVGSPSKAWSGAAKSRRMFRKRHPGAELDAEETATEGADAFPLDPAPRTPVLTGKRTALTPLSHDLVLMAQGEGEGEGDVEMEMDAVAGQAGGS